MANDADSATRPQFDTGPLVTSAVMVGAGTFIALAGLALGGAHLLSATQRWVSEMEIPPSELAKIKLAQARAAVSAGAAAWQNGSSAHPATVS